MKLSLIEIDCPGGPVTGEEAEQLREHVAYVNLVDNEPPVWDWIDW